MLSDVIWFGIDFSFTIMNPLAMHHSKVLPQMYKRLGREEEGPKRVALWYKLRDSMGNPEDPAHQKVRLMKEYGRSRLHSEVFDNDPQAIKMYAEMETTERKPPEGLKEALHHLKERGKTLAVVSEVSSLEGMQTIVDFLRAHGLKGLFDEVITPAGRFTSEGRLLDGAMFRGANKKEGTIYERLATYLDSKGIRAKNRAMIGDDPKQDVDFAKRHGFVTILYKGIVDRGQTGWADFVIKDWKELADST